MQTVISRATTNAVVYYSPGFLVAITSRAPVWRADDFVTSGGKAVDDPDVFGNSWVVQDIDWPTTSTVC